MGSITLDPKKGVNPRLCICPRCGESNNELVLVGIRDFKRKCQDCGAWNYGGGRPLGGGCLKCGGTLGERIMLTPNEKIPTSLCDKCKEDLDMQKSVVDAGGIYFKCKCGTTGAIYKENPICASVREKLNVPTGPCGIELEECPVCQKEESDAHGTGHG